MTRMLSVLCVLVLLAAVVHAQGTEEQAKELVAKAQELAKAKNFGQALALMTKVIALVPNNDSYLGMTSELEFKVGKYAEGLEHAKAAIKLNDKNGDYYILAAYHSFKQQEFDQAKGYCDTVLSRSKELGPTAVQNAQLILQQYLGKRTFTQFWKLDPQRGRSVNGVFTIALPKTGLPYQTVSYEISGVKSHKLVKGEVNDVVLVVPKGKEPFPYTIKITTQPYSYKKELAKASASKPLPASAKSQLGPIYGIDPKSPALKKVVAGLKGDDSVSTIRNIQAWLKKNVEYKLEIKSQFELDFKTVDELIQRGHAECRGYALLFTGLCRAAGIPARPIWGMFRVQPGDDVKFGDIISHNWTEVYIPGAGWIPVDPQWPESLGFLPTHYMRGFMDAQKNRTSVEALPLLNLMSMQNGKLRFEESR
ncbi:MAG TPA: transglutaminase domain-containing protein [Gemmataceae bacterium]|nr:transglutaminase domain-containing protein [Gemmataceae bacterium]